MSASPPPPDVVKYRQTLHSVALATLIACPILALLPPRKLDFYTYGLIGTTAYSANYLAYERTGRSIYQRLNGEARVQPQVAALIETAPVSSARQEYEQPQRVGGGITEEVKAARTQREQWKVEREKEIQDDLDVGKGFGDMIMDQIWDVWNWGKKSDDGDSK